MLNWLFQLCKRLNVHSANHNSQTFRSHFCLQVIHIFKTVIRIFTATLCFLTYFWQTKCEGWDVMTLFEYSWVWAKCVSPRYTLVYVSHSQRRRHALHTWLLISLTFFGNFHDAVEITWVSWNIDPACIACCHGLIVIVWKSQFLNHAQWQWKLPAGQWTVKLDIQTDGRNNRFHSLVSRNCTLVSGSVFHCLPSLIVQFSPDFSFLATAHHCKKRFPR